jgi:hypothetical protein
MNDDDDTTTAYGDGDGDVGESWLAEQTRLLTLEGLD